MQKKPTSGLSTNALAIGAGGLGLAYYLYTQNSNRRKFTNEAKAALKDLKQERDNPSKFTKSDFKTKISKYRGEVQGALNTMKKNGCNPQHSMPYYDNQAKALDTLEKKSAYWKSIAVRVDKGAAGCLTSPTSSLVREITGLAVKLGLTVILVKTVPQVVSWVIDNIGKGGGGGGGGGGGNPSPSPSPSPSPGNGEQVSEQAGGALSALGLASSAVNTVLNAAGLAANTTITLGSSALNTISSVTGKSVTYLTNHPKVAVGVAIIAVAAAILLADPIPGDIAVLGPIIDTVSSVLDISLPSPTVLGQAGAGLSLA